MLQILDDGHITDSQGRKVDFKNTVIIMTSNIGARDIIEPKRLGFNNAANGDIEYKDMKKNVMDKLKDTFKPEFLNRIDEIIVFHPLTRENIKAIVKILFKGLEAKIKENVRVTLKLDENVLEFIAKEGYDQKYGARPLKRAIQTKIEDRLAEKILDGKIKAGGVVTVSAKDDELDFKIKNSSKKEVEEK